MKHFRKVLTLVLAAFMALAVATPAFASDYKITIDNTSNDSVSIVGKEYKAYKVFDLTLGAKNEETGKYGAYAYSINSSDWAYSYLTDGATPDADGVITTTFGIVLTPSASDPTTYTVDGESMTEENARALADALADHLPTTDDGHVTATAETAVIDTGEPGYYAVYGTVDSKDPKDDDNKNVVAALALTNTDPAQTVVPKVSIPTLDKKITAVKEGQTEVDDALLDDDGKAAVAKVGSTVSYELDSIVPDLTGYTDYTFTISDELTSGLDYVANSWKLTIKGAEVDLATCTFTNNASTPRKFTLTIPFSVLDDYDAGDAIVLTYDATVNATSVTYDFEKNTANLEYSNNPRDTTTNKTPDKETYVLNINMDSLKHDANDTPLAGAKFKLYRENGSAKEYYKWADNKVTWVAEDAADVFTTTAEGKFDQQIRGLDQGTYFLLETEAPAGFNLLSDPVEVVITATETGTDTKTVTYSATVDGENATVTNGSVALGTQTANKQPVAVADILNQSGSVLPSTGGMGTTILYALGGILVVGGAIFLIAKNRSAKMGA